eukprot:TRINITY_DN6242_c0_g1_i1.p1 TRINITY_DN6242_c0_g1~~TRINITY_DN6242_c0_g1_i1.p1  ORF type:complete len:370 (+),score=84.05 TRINITY_DN6242_c0_g1_i1:70-1179(+)
MFSQKLNPGKFSGIDSEIELSRIQINPVPYLSILNNKQFNEKFSATYSIPIIPPSPTLILNYESDAMNKFGMFSFGEKKFIMQGVLDFLSSTVMGNLVYNFNTKYSAELSATVSPVAPDQSSLGLVHKGLRSTTEIQIESTAEESKLNLSYNRSIDNDSKFVGGAKLIIKPEDRYINAIIGARYNVEWVGSATVKYNIKANKISGTFALPLKLLPGMKPTETEPEPYFYEEKNDNTISKIFNDYFEDKLIIAGIHTNYKFKKNEKIIKTDKIKRKRTKKKKSEEVKNKKKDKKSDSLFSNKAFDDFELYIGTHFMSQQSQTSIKIGFDNMISFTHQRPMSAFNKSFMFNISLTASKDYGFQGGINLQFT